MQPDDVNVKNFEAILSTTHLRSQLLDSMRHESGTHLPLANHVCKIASQFHTSPDELAQLTDAELSHGCEDFLQHMIFHADMQSSTLMRVYESGLCLTALAHRSGPFELLDRIARDHKVEEAVLTLLVDYYSTDHYSVAQFIDFVRAYRTVRGVQYELTKTTNIPEPKRAGGRTAIGETPT